MLRGIHPRRFGTCRSRRQKAGTSGPRIQLGTASLVDMRWLGPGARTVRVDLYMQLTAASIGKSRGASDWRVILARQVYRNALSLSSCRLHGSQAGQQTERQYERQPLRSSHLRLPHVVGGCVDRAGLDYSQDR